VGETPLNDGPSPAAALRVWVLGRHPSHIGPWVAAVLVTGWLPLGLLAALEDALQGTGNVASFWRDFGVHTRSLLAAPLLVLADVVCSQKLDVAAGHFVESGILARRDRTRFDAIVASTRRWRDSPVVQLTLVAAAYMIVLAIIRWVPYTRLPAWQAEGQGYGPLGLGFSWAGAWHAFVSLPLFLVLALDWIWRLGLWTRFLWLLARFDLRLVASHPDRAGGLRFLGYSVRHYWLLGFTIGCLAAGAVANGIFNAGQPPESYKYLPVIVAAVVAVALNGPLLAFAIPLARVWRRGVVEYGGLAADVGTSFERRWLDRDARPDADPLQAPDFSATTDLYSIAANVYAMQIMPFELRSTAILVVATLLPVIPVLAAILPRGTILEWAAGVLF
jgi:hypothetical protein